MEHAEARELLEIAAVEPGGFERLMAGDTPEAAALAGHVAGCPDCTAEMERLRRAAIVIRDALRTVPPADLRDRTLAYVAAVGRPRGGSTPSSPPVPVELGHAGGPRRLAVVTPLMGAVLAAAVVVSVVGTSLFVGASRESVIQAQATQIASLAKVATWSLRIDGQEDARYVALAPPAGTPDLAATLSFSPSTKELVVLAEGLTQPPPGMQYRCWVEIGGSRRRIGQMFFGGGVAYWVGAVDQIAETGPGTLFGVSLVPSDGDSLAGDPVLLGEL